MSIPKTLTITFGAMAPPMEQQLRGLLIPPKEVDRLEKLARAVTILKIHGILVESEYRKAHGRIMRQIDKAILEARG